MSANTNGEAGPSGSSSSSVVHRHNELSARQREKAPARISLDQITLDERRLDHDIVQLISQYLSQTHPHIAQQIDDELLDGKADSSRKEESQEIERAILDGDYGSLESLLSRPALVRGQTVKAFLYLCYRQQFLEHVENRESQKAFNLLQKRLKPLEHYQPYPYDFYALSYLTSASTVHDAPSFRDWGGVGVERERLVAVWREIMDGAGSIDGGSTDGREKRYVPPNRLVELFKQAVAWQVGHHGVRTGETNAWTVHSLLQDYRPLIVPSDLNRLVSGHTANVKCIGLIGPEGNTAISGSSDTTLHIFSTLSGETRHILSGHTSRVWDVASSGPGPLGWIASSSGDGTVRIWSNTGKSRTAISGDGGDVYGVRWRPGREDQIASASYDKIVRCWDVETGKQVRTFSGHGQSTLCVAFDPVGNVIASGSKDKHIRLWDAVGGVCIQSMTASLGEITSVEFDPEGRYLLAGCKDNSNLLWDLRMQRNIYRYTGHQNTSKNLIRCSFSPGGNLVVGGSEDSMVYIWEREASSALQHSRESSILHQNVVTRPGVSLANETTQGNMSAPLSPATYNRASPAYYPPRNVHGPPHAKNPSGGTIVKPLKVLEGHGEGAVFDVKWTGEVMVSAGEDRRVGVWRIGDN
ncbi:WD40-repeat-containing domain protein [Naematelia encephala]|uniref:WD40-repeat-containing domain protein n=1 Tax=Naematelia encephala TaxID=71784 RepID=A0A1Y2ARM9_9TREE|nr:WD40-repeat-containing domain protein [Naematelia encephala]